MRLPADVEADDPSADPNPTPEHETRVGVLEALAGLTGHGQRVPLPLPDGRIPDLLMANLSTRGLFLGDGKESEGPTDLDSRARLDGYASWLAPHVRGGRPALFAVCCPSLAQARAWMAFLHALLRQEHDLNSNGWAKRMDPDAAVGAVFLAASTE